MTESLFSTEDVFAWIREDLPKKVRRDVIGPHSKIFREADLQACVYFHLRKFLSRDRTWTILNCPQFADFEQRYFPDIVLSQQHKRRIVIELKFRHRQSGMSTHDQKKLIAYKTTPEFGKYAAWIEVIRNDTGVKKGRVALPKSSKKFFHFSLNIEKERLSERYEKAYTEFHNKSHS